MADNPCNRKACGTVLIVGLSKARKPKFNFILIIAANPVPVPDNKNISPEGHISQFYPLVVLKLIRVPHWIKNLLLFFPILFGAHLNDSQALKNCLIGFVVICFLASSIYVLNDIADVESDRKHPVKRYRPIANRQVSIPSACLILFLLLALSGGLAYFFLPSGAWYWLALYFVLNLLYSFKLKQIGLLDVFIVSFFFEIRLFLGGMLAGVTVSLWLCMLTFFLATFIAFSKRRDDLILSETNQESRSSIRNYNTEFLNAILLLLASTILIIYLLYSISDTGGLKFHPNFYMSSLFVFLGITRYLQLIFVLKKGGNPVRIFYSDKLLVFCWVGWLASIVYFIYF